MGGACVQGLNEGIAFARASCWTEHISRFFIPEEGIILSDEISVSLARVAWVGSGANRANPRLALAQSQ